MSGGSWRGVAVVRLLTLAVVCLFSTSAAAQSSRPGNIEISVGGIWAAGFGLGEAAAKLTSNQQPAGQTLNLFETKTQLLGAANAELRLGYGFARDWAIEAGASYARPSVRTDISNDFELGAISTVARERLYEYVFDASLVYEPRPWHFRQDRARLFVLGGAGYLRDLHEGRTVVVEGTRYHVGGGAKYFFAVRPAARLRALGVRADARIYLRDGGVNRVDEAIRRSAGAGVAFMLVF